MRELNREDLWGQAGSRGLVREEKAFPLSSLMLRFFCWMRQPWNKATRLCFGKMVRRSYKDLTLLPYLPTKYSPGRVQGCPEKDNSEWRSVHTPEQPGKGKDHGGHLRFQLNRIGVSWDKAKVFSKPEGFLVLLHFKGLRQQVEVLMLVTFYWEASFITGSDRQPKYRGSYQLPR